MKYKDLCEHFAIAPDNELDASQAIKFKAFAQRDTDPTSSELKQILDDCAYASLASGFVMSAMSFMLQMLLKDEAENTQEQEQDDASSN